MTEKQLIQKIQGLREIQPRKDWVVLTKGRILGEEPEGGDKWHAPLFFLRYKLALAPVISVLVIIGLFGFAYNTVPGDLLFSVKKITETAQVSFSSTDEKPEIHLKLANKRLAELGRIAEDNQVKNLGPAIEEFQANVAEATRNLMAMEANVTTSDPFIVRGIIEEAQKLEENKKNVENILATIIGEKETEELKNSIYQLEKETAAQLIKGFEEQLLLDEDQKLLAEAKEFFEAGDYSQALYKIWLLSNE